MKNVISILKKELPDRNSVFVFPSEITASFWNKRALDLTDQKALRSSRFISWDHFKEIILGTQKPEQPVNAVIRALFTISLLKKNSCDSSVFSCLINPKFSSNSISFLKYINSILPVLKSFNEIDSVNLAKIPVELLNDLSFLYKEYNNFLNSNNLFEPSYEEYVHSDISDKKYFLFFKDTIADFHRYSAQLNSSPIVTLVSFAECDTPVKNKIKCFSSSAGELRWVFSEIARLLRNGESIRQIAVSVPRLMDMDKDLIFLSEKYNIPINLRYGRVLTDYPEGRLFSILSECFNTGNSIETLRALFLNNSYPWKEKDKGKNLVKFGIEKYCNRNYLTRDKNRGKIHSVWKRELKKHGEQDLLQFYNHFTTALKDLITSETFDELNKNLTIFISNFLDTSLWDNDSLYIFQGCRDFLNNIAVFSNKFTFQSSVSPYALWLMLMKEKIYVKKSTTDGIPVYPYKVSAGIFPKYHFIVMASEETIKVTIPPFPFLRDDQRSAINIEEKNLSSDFLKLYLLSGKNVCISCSKETPFGPELPPGYFITDSMIENITAFSDMYENEKQFWPGGEAPEFLSPLQVRGLERIAATSFIRKRNNFTKQKLPTGDQVKIFSIITEDKGFLPVSAASLEDFHRCPFYYLMKKGLQLHEKRYHFEFSTSLEKGIIFHSLLAGLLTRIKRTEGSFQAGNIEKYKTILKDEFQTFIDRREKGGVVFFDPVWEAEKDRIWKALITFLEKETKVMPDYKIREIEKKYEAYDSEKKILLKGRVDRISENEDSIVLIDYKLKNAPEKRSVAGDDPSSFQMPFYIYLASLNNLRITKALYYLILSGKYIKVFDLPGGGWLDTEGITTVIQKVEDNLSLMLKDIDGGKFHTNSSDSNCLNCYMKRICRERFTVR